MIPKLSICIPVFNQYGFTKNCLIDLSYLSKDHEIIIIDNGSTDETKSALENSKEIIYHRFNENKGFGKACNKAYELSTSNNVMFLNNDVELIGPKTVDWTKPLIDKCNEGLVGAQLGYFDENYKLIPQSNIEMIRHKCIYGWCLASSKENFNKIQEKPGEVFCEDYFAYFEDFHLSLRAEQLGIPLFFERVPLKHFGRTTSKHSPGQMLYANAHKVFLQKWKK